MKPEEELIQLRAEKQVLREKIEQRENQRAQRDELIAQVLQRVQVLEERLSKDSHNSSLPPSSDRFARQKESRSLRTSSGKKAGGEQGHPGTTLEMSETPDEVVVVLVPPCQHCQADLSTITATSRERRQVVDVPLPRLRITQYQGECKQCPQCQGYTSATFPLGVKASVQDGPRVGAMAVYLLIQHLLPWGGSCEVLTNPVGVHLSEGPLAKLIERTAEQVVPVEEQIKTALSAAKVINQDETGRYVKRRRTWLHGTSTPKLTHYQVHESRGHKALDMSGIVANFTGISVHDCCAGRRPSAMAANMPSVRSIFCVS